MIRIDKQTLDALSERAKVSPRLRQNLNFHKESSDTLHRMLNAMEPQTYVQPHKHVAPEKREAFIVLRGSVCLIEFDNEGGIVDSYIMTAGPNTPGAEITPGVYHTLIALKPGTIIYEIKDGPWDAAADKVFALWAPDETSGKGPAYNGTLLKALNVEPIV